MSKRNKNKIPERINRFTPYITFLPKSLRTEKVKKARIEAYINGKATSHWSNKCEIKTYPYGFKKLYESRGFNDKLISAKAKIRQNVIVSLFIGKVCFKTCY